MFGEGKEIEAAKGIKTYLHVSLGGTIPGDGAIGDVVINVVNICRKALILRPTARVEEPQ